ncbi:DUF4357 domain-containing protein [Rhodococcus sp. Q]|uniref:DUF4357 domain-containing protein n=1 Tax=Rhodococcus sp. Q TaxID=2502252 RepID=UPI0010F49860|nr:DUF4357 domain-containing protein [Rhodococcus sp. Q]
MYVLLGPSSSGPHHETVYIGEGDVMLTRIDNHHKSKDFWTRGYVLTSQNNYLNKAHVRYLESRLIEIAKRTGVVGLHNGTAPDPIGLGEAEESDMEVFLDEALPLFPLLGVVAFDTGRILAPSADQPISKTESGSTRADASTVHEFDDPGRKLFLTSHGVQAEGRDDQRGFIVAANSLARRATGEMTSYRKLRDQLTADGILREWSSTQLILTRDYVFDSPSAAATVLCGTSRNGRLDWKTADGITLKELQDREATFNSGPLDDRGPNTAQRHATPERTQPSIPAPSSTRRERRQSRISAQGRSTPVHYDEDIALLLDLGYLNPGDTLHFEERKKGLRHIATIEPDGALRIGTARYGAPSTALGACVGYSVNGWTTWRIEDGRKLGALRNQARRRSGT